MNQEPVSQEHDDSSELQAKAGRDVSHLAGKYLTFFLAGEQFGIEITKIREILGVLDITPVPQTADFLLGVINLRGKVIPVMDLRLRFNQEYREPDERTCIIVVEVTKDDGRRILMSMVVDQVNEVLNVSAADIDATPAFGTNLDTAFIMGMAKTQGGVKILLDVDRIVQESRLVVG
ncbi:chemotaxis protein CheW [Desulfocarbo indianensis]|nr:chemotaxis protein CheW [Desulfocarbo indianensis]